MKLGMSYFGNRYKDCAKRHFRHMKEIGVSYIVFTFSENDLAFYEHTMHELFSLAHSMGMEVWADPWGMGGVFGGEAFSAALLASPDDWQVRSDGKSVPHACLNSRRFRNFVKLWIDSVVAGGADYTFWDEPHWYIPGWDASAAKRLGMKAEDMDIKGLWACRCNNCQNLFFQRYGHPMPKEMTEEVSEFRQASAYDFLREMTEYGKVKGIKNAICFLPLDNKQIGIPDADSIASLDSVDVIGSDPYWYIFNRSVDDFVKPVTQRFIELGRKYSKEVHMWFQGYKVPAGRELEMEEAVKKIHELGVRNAAVWAYNGASHMSYLRSDDPEKVNRILEDIFKKFSKK